MQALAVLHIADLFREPKMVLPSQMDWARIPRILKGALPKPVPPRPVCVPGACEDALNWMGDMIASPPDYFVLDTEYTISGKTLLTLGLGARRGDSFSGCQVMQIPRLHSWERLALPKTLHTLVGVAPVVVQNLMADLPVLRDNWQIPFTAYKQIEDLMLAHALLWTEFPHDLEFLASLYSAYPKLKHLSERDPALYNWGDVLATDESWQAVARDLRADPQTEHIYRTRSLPLAFVLIRGHEAGVKVDKLYAQSSLIKLGVVTHRANLRAQATAGYPINVGSTQQVQKILLERDGIKVKNLMAENLNAAVLKHPTCDLLQARREFAQADGFRKFVAGIANEDRVFPEFLPTQATGRISVKNPNIPGCPDDGKADQRVLPRLRRCFVPDPGWWWLCWDWNAMHARFMAAACRDWSDIKAYQEGKDIHALTVKEGFGMEVTPRLRHLAKTVRYALLNGLDERAVRESNEVAELGMDMDELERYARKFLANKPAQVQWKRDYIAKSLAARHSRSLYGRKRVLINFGDRSRDENAKAAISGFLQGTEVDIMVETLVEALRRWPEAHLVYPSHDGIKLAFPDSTDSNAVIADLKPWVERSHDFWGVQMPLPAEWEIIRGPEG